MPIEIQPLYAQEAPNARGIVKAGVGLWCPSFAEVFDWLISEKDISICIYHEVDWFIGWSVTQYYKTIHNGEHYEQWHEAAEKAIEKALELIKKD